MFLTLLVTLKPSSNHDVSEPHSSRYLMRSDLDRWSAGGGRGSWRHGALGLRLSLHLSQGLLVNHQQLATLTANQDHACNGQMTSGLFFCPVNLPGGSWMFWMFGALCCACASRGASTCGAMARIPPGGVAALGDGTEVLKFCNTVGLRVTEATTCAPACVIVFAGSGLCTCEPAAHVTPAADGVCIGGLASVTVGTVFTDEITASGDVLTIRLGVAFITTALPFKVCTLTAPGFPTPDTSGTTPPAEPGLGCLWAAVVLEVSPAAPSPMEPPPRDPVLLMTPPCTPAPTASGEHKTSSSKSEPAAIFAQLRSPVRRMRGLDASSVTRPPPSASASVGSPGVYSALGPFSPLRRPAYNQLGASSLLNQQYAAALGLGSVLPGVHVRRVPMVEKAVQTLHVDGFRQMGGSAASQERLLQWERRRLMHRPREESPLARKSPADDGARRRRNRSRGQLMVAHVPSASLKFETDFDFDSSNAQFIKEELERDVRVTVKVYFQCMSLSADGKDKGDEKENEKEELLSTATDDDPFGPKCYYDKAKSFFDNISSDNKFRLTWSEERKRNLETFGVPGRFLRGQGFRGGYTGLRGRGTSRIESPYRTRSTAGETLPQRLPQRPSLIGSPCRTRSTAGEALPQRTSLIGSPYRTSTVAEALPQRTSLIGSPYRTRITAAEALPQRTKPGAQLQRPYPNAYPNAVLMYQQILHRNLVYLATIADSNQNMQSLLPAPPTPNMSVGPGGMGPSNLNDNMAPGPPPSAMMQNQMSNGPGHAPMQQHAAQVQSATPSASLSQQAGGYGSPASGYGHAAPSSQSTGPGYGSSSSSSSSSYTPSSSSSRSNLNMQSNQISMMQQQSTTAHYSSAQVGGQHYQGQQAVGMVGQGGVTSQRPGGTYRSAQQGHGEYSYQQSSYGEQGYDRSFDESSQHYYEGGNSQYSQQQAQYQQGSGQQPFSQQQFSSQQGYGGQPQGYGPGQAGSSQYSQYQQAQSQQYGSYRSSQAGSGAQTQRPYAYEQGRVADVIKRQKKSRGALAESKRSISAFTL
ncbi:Calcium-responsive transactivator [Liparis tanakae]|uniref:Calcium-responsive transactivator n=1 Tax=Liparis tanakae TaxID=230148 RepID=A0A4Z2FQX5_9TELE|nr:Calcium-responsive transactivator [Liparis tanakae]